MEEKNNNEYNAEMAINEYLSLLQIKYDCETVYSLVKSLQQDGITGFGIIPYFTLTAATILEMLSSNEIKLEIPYSARIKDIRMKLKIFEDGYSKSKRMLLAIDYLQNEIFKNRLTFSFMKSWNIHYNLGIYTNKDKIVIGNTQYNYYLLQDNRFLKKSLNEIATAYKISPNNFNLDEHVGKECYQYAYTCAQFINSIRSGLESFDTPITINSNKNIVDFYYADYNTNRKSALLPQGENGKAIFLYLLHTLSTMNFLLYVLNDYEEHEAFGRGKLLISLQFDKSVCNNQISLLLQNVFVWLLMRSGAFFARSHQPNKAVVNFNVLVSLTVYDGSFSNFNAVNQFLNDFPVQFLQVQILPDGSGPLVDIGDVLLGFSFPG